MAIVRRVTRVLPVSLVLLAVGLPARAQDPVPADNVSTCNAQVSIRQIGTLSGQLGMTYKYRVNIKTDVPSAMVAYQVSRSYTRPDGTTFKDGVSWHATVRDGASEEIGEYIESEGRRPVDWSVENVLCKRFGPASASRDAQASRVCNLTGVWVDVATTKSRQYTAHLKSEGTRVTGHAVGQNVPPGAFVGEAHGDGNVVLKLSVAMAPDLNYTLRANPDCSRLQGSYTYHGGFGVLHLHSGSVDLVKQ
jgi:hypothetical protein